MSNGRSLSSIAVVSSLSSAISQMTPFERIRALLDIRMRNKKDPRIYPRRLELSEAFKQLGVEDAIPLKLLLESRGLTRPRDPSNVRLVTRFKRLARPTREQMVGILTGTIKHSAAAERVPGRPLQRRKFEFSLPRVANSLSHVRFGRAEIHGYDKDHWKVVRGGRFGADLVLNSKLTASGALRAIVTHPHLWSMDCSQWVQAVTMITLVDAIGDNAFNKEVSSRGQFKFRVQWSTGLKPRVGWERWNSSVLFKRFVPPSNVGQPEERDVQKLIKDSLPGTRLAVSTGLTQKLSKTSPWRFENTVKIGQDRFAAHGFSRRTFSLNELTTEYAKTIAKIIKMDLGIVRRTVFVQSIERFEQP